MADKSISKSDLEEILQRSVGNRLDQIADHMGSLTKMVDNNTKGIAANKDRIGSAEKQVEMVDRATRACTLVLHNLPMDEANLHPTQFSFSQRATAVRLFLAKSFRIADEEALIIKFRKIEIRPRNAPHEELATVKLEFSDGEERELCLNAAQKNGKALNDLRKAAGKPPILLLPDYTVAQQRNYKRKREELNGSSDRNGGGRGRGGSRGGQRGGFGGRGVGSGGRGGGFGGQAKGDGRGKSGGRNGDGNGQENASSETMEH